MIKNVFLDLDDTLFDFQRGERKAIKATFDELGIAHDDSTVARYVEINLDCWRALERGEMNKEQVLVGRFERLFDELNISASPTEAQRIYEQLLSREHDFIPGAVELLSDFDKSGKYRLFMATNGIPEVQNPRIDAAGIRAYFDGIFISEEIGYAKPSKKYFELCFGRIEGFERKETVIVGDSLSSDILGGINSGIRTVHFNPKELPYEKIIPDYKIKSLGELIPLLESIT